MTPQRRKHLEWIRAREPIGAFDGTGPTLRQLAKMVEDGDAEEAGRERGGGIFGFTLYRVTDRARAELDAADVGQAAIFHLKDFYPATLAAVPKTAEISLRNFINNRVQGIVERMRREPKE